MGLNSKMVIASDLQSYFVDKDTGLPLANGKIKFYQDASRETEKDVYILSGSPPYDPINSYTNIGSEVTLSSVGTVQYQNDDVIIYYFPYDLTPATTTGTIQLYYVIVESEGEVQQFTREAWPNLTSTGSAEGEGNFNYIPNGQFLAHNYLPATDTLQVGEIREDSTSLAPGGFYFHRTTGSTAKDIITFERQASYLETPSASPRYICVMQRESLGVSPGTSREFAIRFKDVNKFASDTQSYSFGISAFTTSGGSLAVGVYIRKFFGENGSPTEDTSIGTITIDSNESMKTISNFVFGSNTIYTIGDDNLDYVEIVFKIDVNNLSVLKFVDAVLTVGDVALEVFPQTTTSDTLTRTIAGWMDTPSYTGMDLYLPLRLTKDGMKWDDSEIGDIIAESQNSDYTDGLSNTTNRMQAKGDRYKVSDYSPLGIPYERLFNKYFNPTANIPKYGTGVDFSSAGLNTGDSQIILSNNTQGVVTAISAGTTSFTVSTVYTSLTAAATIGNFKCYMVGSDTFYAETITKTAVNAEIAIVGTPGPTVSNIQIGSSLLFDISQIVCPNGAGITVGAVGNHYIKIYYGSGTNDFNFVWYTVDTVGNNPAVAGGTGIQVNVLSTDTAAIVAQKTRTAMNNWQVSRINTVAASSITAGQYFRFYVTDSSVPNWVVWFKTDGTGTQPVIANANFIPVNVIKAGTPDTAAQVAFKIQTAINSVYFASPDLRGYILRGWDNSAGNDPNSSTRWSMVPGIIGDEIGTFQLSQNISHYHTGPDGLGFVFDHAEFCAEGENAGGSRNIPPYTANEGGSESRPINTYVQWIIKY